jgi:uncharacterized protein
MNSCLYECHVLHARFAPRQHRFLYRIFLFAIDLDELEILPKTAGLFSLGGRSIYSFHDSDFMPTGEPLYQGDVSATAPAPRAGQPLASQLTRPLASAATKSPDATTRPAVLPPRPKLKQRVVNYAARHGVDLTGGRIVLVTLPRVFGYLFNPVSFYFCYDRTGAPAAAIAEVTNTFREIKPYFLAPPAQPIAPASQAAPNGAPTAFHLRAPKYFYVSPFSDVDVAFDFTLRTPAAKLSVQIDDYIGVDRTLTSTVSGTRHELTASRLVWFTCKYPLITLRIITAIHWQAFRLWCKRVPWFSKAARPNDQRELYRPHQTLQPTDAA